MNNVVMMGRLTRDVEMRHSKGENAVAVANFAIAVNRSFKREGEPDADFFNCVAFGKTGETIEKWFKKGSMICIQGRLQNNNYKNKDGQTVYSMQILVNEFSFCGKSEQGSSSSNSNGEELYHVDESVSDNDVPF